MQRVLQLIIPVIFFVLVMSCELKKITNHETVLDYKVTIINELKDVPFVKRRDANYESRYIKIEDSISLYVIDKGEGIPMVLLNGGPGNSCHSFIPYFDKASEFSRIVLYDPRGVGKSDWKPVKGYSTTQLIDDLEKLRQKMRIDKWVVAGWSFGGLAAQHYALKYPESVLGLVLINSSYSSDYNFKNEEPPDYISTKERERIKKVYSIGGNRVVPTHNDSVGLEVMKKMVFNGYINGDWKRQFFYKPTKEEMAAVALYEWNHDKDYNRLVAKDGFSNDLSGLFKDFKKPVLLYYGKHDMTFNSELPNLMQQEFRDSKLIILENSSHNPFKEEPEIFFNELKRFITRFNH